MGKWSQMPVVNRAVPADGRLCGGPIVLRDSIAGGRRTVRLKRARRERFRSGITDWHLGSGSEGDPFAKPVREPGLVNLACRDGEHCLDGIVGVGLLVVP